MVLCMLTACTQPAASVTEGEVSAISGGRDNTAAVSSSGLYTWGRNTFGVLGHGTETDAAAPRRVQNFPPGTTTVTSIVTGQHTVALLSDGTLYAWGNNNFGQFGDGTTTSRPTPTLVPNFPPPGTTITSIAVGYIHTLATLDGGTVLYAWGENTGQLGLPSTSDMDPVKTTPTLVPNFPPAGRTITGIAGGASVSAALLDNGTLYVWGKGLFGELGGGSDAGSFTPKLVPSFPPGGTKITQIAVGTSHVVALLDDGSLFTWGWNHEGQLGYPSVERSSTPLQVPDFPPAGRSITSIDAGFGHTGALLDDGTIYTWGYNAFGQLGEAPSERRISPAPVPNFPPASRSVASIALGWDHTVALLDDGTVYVWGSDGTPTASSTPKLVTLP
jgi:alpha-tubulin suppressor-like RCC1 family protein